MNLRELEDIETEMMYTSVIWSIREDSAKHTEETKEKIDKLLYTIVLQLTKMLDDEFIEQICENIIITHRKIRDKNES